MRKFLVATLVILLAFTAMLAFCKTSQQQVEATHNVIATAVEANSAATTSPHIPATINFAGEAVPIELFDVRESLERELIVNMNFHSNTLQCIKRCARYFPVIEPILAANGVPDDFKFLALIESDLMNKVSPAGATGFWQFVKSAATENGLELTAEVDERYHVEKATVAACRYLNNAFNIFGSWTMAAASYNMGRGGLSRQITRQQCNNYYDLLLNDETARYMYRILAMKTIINTPETYGFNVPDSEKYKPLQFTELQISTAVADWTDFAYEHGTNYKMLKYFNPWLRDSKLVNKARRTYTIKIPAEGYNGRTQHRISKNDAAGMTADTAVSPKENKSK